MSKPSSRLNVSSQKLYNFYNKQRGRLRKLGARGRDFFSKKKKYSKAEFNVQKYSKPELSTGLNRLAETKASLRVFEKCGSGKDTEKQQFPMEAETENMQSRNN